MIPGNGICCVKNVWLLLPLVKSSRVENTLLHWLKGSVTANKLIQLPWGMAMTMNHWCTYAHTVNKNLPFSCSTTTVNSTWKTHHSYHFQVQGQLHFTRRSWCDFVVCSPSEISVQRIRYDNELWRNKMYPPLRQFFVTALMPKIVSPRNSISEIRKNVPFNGSTVDNL